MVECIVQWDSSKRRVKVSISGIVAAIDIRDQIDGSKVYQLLEQVYDKILQMPDRIIIALPSSGRNKQYVLRVAKYVAQWLEYKLSLGSKV